MVASRPKAATPVVARPTRVIVRTGYRPDSRDPTAEATNIAMETGSSCLAACG